MAKTNILGSFSTGLFAGLGERQIQKDLTDEEIRKQTIIRGLNSKADMELERVRSANEIKKTREAQELEKQRYLAVLREKDRLDQEAQNRRNTSLGLPTGGVSTSVPTPDESLTVDDGTGIPAPTETLEVDPTETELELDNTTDEPAPLPEVEDNSGVDTITGGMSDAGAGGGTNTVQVDPTALTDEQKKVAAASKDPAATMKQFMIANQRAAKQSATSSKLSPQDAAYINTLRADNNAESRLAISDLRGLISRNKDTGLLYTGKAMLGHAIPALRSKTIDAEKWDKITKAASIELVKNLKPASDTDLLRAEQTLPQPSDQYETNVPTINRLTAKLAMKDATANVYEKWAANYGSLNAKNELGQTVHDVNKNVIESLLKEYGNEKNTKPLDDTDVSNISAIMDSYINAKMAKTPEEAQKYIDQIRAIKEQSKKKGKK